MSATVPKKKEKRPRSGSNETNSSFVRNVTSAMSGLLPATITKWFSSPSSSSANGSAPAADATDSSTEDEAPESPVAQPPAKRVKYSTPGPYEQFTVTEASTSVTTTETAEAPYNPYTTKPFPIRSTLSSTLSTPTEEKAKEPSENEATTTQKSHSVSSIGQSVAHKRKSIFDKYMKDDSKRACVKTSANTMRDPKQPAFKAALLGSPFYPGRTMYGGAASSSYINHPNIRQKKVAVVNESNNNDDSAMSTSARRIMDLLEEYSSPLREAKRLPPYTKMKPDPLDTSLDTQPSNRSTSYPYKTQELHVPSIASILRLKQRSRLMDTTNAARQLIASHSSTSLDYPPYSNSGLSSRTDPEDQSNKMTTKVKARVTRTNRGAADELEIATPVKLPTAVLSIDQDNLPKFNFGTPAVSLPATATSTPKSVFNVAEGKKTSDTFTSDAKQTEKPAKPDKWRCQECWVDNVADANKCACCGAKPASANDKKVDKCVKCKVADRQLFKDKCFNCDKIQVNSSGNMFGAKSNGPAEWKCSDCWAPNKPDSTNCACCGAKAPSTTSDKASKCSVCKYADCLPLKNKCVNCDKVQLNNVGNLFAFKSPDESKWKCEECWVNNDNSLEKCVSCGSRKSKTVTATVSAPAVKSGDAEWKCEDCWISNKSSANKCAACGGAKPGVKKAPATIVSGSPFFKTPDDSFKVIAKSQSQQKWECSSCLVRNEANKSMCVCCGAEKESTNKMPAKKFNFGSNTSFKFGINPNDQEASLAKKPELPILPKVKELSEKNNNILPETPTFTFTLPTKKLEDKVDAPKPKGFDTAKPAFSFGIPKQTTPLSTTPIKTVDPPQVAEEKEKPQEVPKINFSMPASQEPMKPLGGGLFSSPLTMPTGSNLTNAASFGTPTKADEHKNTHTRIPLASDSPQSRAGSSSKPVLGGFSFGGSLKPASNLFTPPTTTATVTSLFVAPAQPATTAVAPTLSLFKPPEASNATSMFQKPNPTTTATTTLFQASATTTSASTALPAGPIFSFGSNTSNPTPAPAAEKPAMTFNFGGNAAKTDSSPFGATNAFKSPFPPSGDNTSNNNSFSLPTGNALGSGSTLNANPLGGGNGISNGNGLSGNSMGSGLGNNPLGGTNGLPPYPLGGGNGLQSGNNTLSSTPSGMFSPPGQKENMWSSNNNQPANPFVVSTTANTMQKPAAFTFGSSTPFNAGSSSVFGGNTQQPAQNIFGMNQNNNNNQPSMFSSPVQSQPGPNIFGAPQAVAHPAQQMPMFGSPSGGAAPAFGSPTPSMPAFETQAAPAPSFNFGGGAPSSGIFGFGQQQQQQQQQQQPQQGVYSFGGAPAGGSPQVQFNIGSGANPVGGLSMGGGANTARRMRKAVRRNPPR